MSPFRVCPMTFANHVPHRSGRTSSSASVRRLSLSRTVLRDRSLAVTDEDCRRASCPDGQAYGRLSVGYGVILFTSPSGHKSWRFRYDWGGRVKDITLGVFPFMGVDEARRLAVVHRDSIRRLGVDPASKLREMRRERRVAAVAPTFEEVAERWIAHKVATSAWTAMSPVDRARWRRGEAISVRSTELKARGRLRLHVLPYVGSLKMDRAATGPIISDLFVRARGAGYPRIKSPQEAAKCFEYFSGIVRFWIRETVAETGVSIPDPITPFEERGSLRPVESDNYAAITNPVMFGQMVADLKACPVREPAVWPLMACQIYLFQRVGALVQMRWGDLVQVEGGWIWRCPKDSMKKSARDKKKFAALREVDSGDARAYFEVPLPRQVVELLTKLRAFTGSGEFVFAGRGRSGPVSPNSLLQLIRRAGYAGRQTAHSFRACAQTIMGDHFNVDNELIERHLDHTGSVVLGGAYDRRTFTARRVLLLQEWADLVDWLSAGKAISSFHSFPDVLKKGV